MRAKFAAYAGNLADTDLYDQQLFDAVSEMQRRYGLPVNGLIGYSTKIRMGYLAPAKPTLLTVNGSGVDMWTGPQAVIARAVEDIYYWQPIGYDSKPIPMAPGVAQARAELGVQLDHHPGLFAMVIYSEGALAGSQFFKYDLLPPNGRYHHRLPDLVKVVAIGNPYRERGVVWDVDGNPARPGTQGISDDRLVNTPGWWRELAHHGDIYAENTVDDAGEFKTAIYKAVQGQFVGGADSLLHQVMELVGNPLGEGFAAAQAILTGIGFYAGRTGPHVNYPTQQAIDYLRAGPMEGNDMATTTGGFTWNKAGVAGIVSALLSTFLPALLGLLHIVGPVAGAVNPGVGAIVGVITAALTWLTKNATKTP